MYIRSIALACICGCTINLKNMADSWQLEQAEKHRGQVAKNRSKDAAAESCMRLSSTRVWDSAMHRKAEQHLRTSEGHTWPIISHVAPTGPKVM